jgi:DNA helicase-2/ATP-dependent DNA helicase PcrA
MEASSMDDILRDLTTAQRSAVTHIHGPQLILAGPGSGKTRVVTHRIAHMLDQGIPPWNITALTFTNKAADEMRRRLDKLAPGKPVWMGTFHRFCAQMLRRNASLVGLKENYSILDTSDSNQLLKRAIDLAGVSTSHTSPEKIGSAIGRFKNRLVLPEMLEGQSLAANEHVAARVYGPYQQLLLTSNAVDFDDLLLHVACLLRDNPELRSDLDSKNRFILVDEYQDTNLAQYAIVRALSIDHPNLSVTGDPDQSIYGWRGADVSNILSFEKDYGDVHVVRLEENYRSTPEILNVADTLIRNNTRRKAKDLFTSNPSGPPVALRMYRDNYHEADDIAEQIATRMATGDIKPGDVAIFCRMNSLTRSFEHAFQARQIPYQIVNGTEFYKRKEIKDILAYLHLVNNSGNDVAFARVINTPPRGIGAKTLKTLTAHADRHRIPLLEAAREVHTLESISARYQKKVAEFVSLYEKLCLKATADVADFIEYLVAEIDFRKHLEQSSDDAIDNSRIDNVDELISAASEFDMNNGADASLELFLERVALVSDSDAFENDGNRVSIMTLHAAKGLEFPVVYLIAIENNVLPHQRSTESAMQMEEERRLLFVGITRAERELQLSYVKHRMTRGRPMPMAPSFFLMELPRDSMKMVDAIDPADHLFGHDDINQDPGGSHYDSSGDDAGGYPSSWDFDDSSQVDDFPQDDSNVDTRRGDRSGGAGSRNVREPAIQMSGLKTASEMLAKRDAGQLAGNNFHPGTRVSHPKYGEGQVMTVSGRADKQTAKVKFDIGHVQSFILRFAPLEVVEGESV